MIIWGWREITSAISDNNFHCPRCSQIRSGSLSRVQKYFTVYFIPLLPVGAEGRYVACNSCAGTFGEEILNHNPEYDQRERLMKMLRVLVMAALADGTVDNKEQAEIQKQYSALAGVALGQEALGQQIGLAKASGTDLNGLVKQFAHELSEKGKALVVKLSFETMAASENFNRMHQSQLSRLPQTLGITEAKYKSIIKGATLR